MVTVTGWEVAGHGRLRIKGIDGRPGQIAEPGRFAGVHIAQGDGLGAEALGGWDCGIDGIVIAGNQE